MRRRGEVVVVERRTFDVITVTRAETYQRIIRGRILKIVVDDDDDDNNGNIDICDDGNFIIYNQIKIYYVMI